MRVPRGPPKDCSTRELQNGVMRVDTPDRVARYLSGVTWQREAVQAIHAALAGLGRGRWLLAVSGGRDSMVALDAFSSARAGEIAAVATFDHGTGPAARRAAALVVREAGRRCHPVVHGVTALPQAGPGAAAPAAVNDPASGALPVTLPGGSEAEWRAARWRFLGGWARELGATVVTAHTRDDQVETVVQRLLRDAGVRGMAGMRAEGPGPMGAPVVRPFLGTPRSALGAYARARRVAFVEDPSNRSRSHQRNRVRLDLLPALERAVPGFGEWCLSLAARAAAWRDAMDACVDALGVTLPDPGTAVLRAGAVAGYGPRDWEVLWPAIAARVGVTMDRRGIVRAAAWAPGAAAGSHIPLAGAARIERTAASFVLRRIA
jgi:tRNA(Ile)-lysidine synthase